MSPLARRLGVVAVALLTIGAGMLLGLAGLPQPDRTLEFSSLILAAMVTSALALQRSTTKDWAIMPPSFVVDFSALLLLGPDAMMLVATAGALVHGLTDAEVPHRLRRTLFTAATVVAAAQAAGLVHQVSGGTIGNFVWPAQGVPIALAVIAYCVVKSASAELIVPLLTRQSINRSWPASILRGAPLYLIGASIAVGLVTIVDHRIWEVVPVVVAPLYFALPRLLCPRHPAR